MKPVNSIASSSGSFLPSGRFYPMLPFLLALVGGILIGLFFDIADQVWLILAALFASAMAITLSIRQFEKAAVAALILFVCIGAFRSSGALARDARHRIHELSQRSDSIAVGGRVLAVTQQPHSTVIALRRATLVTADTVLSCDPLTVHVRVRQGDRLKLRIGDEVIVEGQLRDGMKWASSARLVHVLANGVGCSILSDTLSCTVIRRGGSGLARMADAIRTRTAAAFDSYARPDGAALCKALVLGDRGGFSQDFNDALRISGLSHVFALSGVNVGLLISLLWLILALLLVPRTLRIWTLLLFLILYAEVGRHSPSLVRASLMCGLYLLGLLLYRRAGIVNVIASAGLLELMWRPLDLLDPGFQLSYLAVAGLAGGAHLLGMFRRRTTTPRRLPVLLATIAGATAITQIATAPLTAHLFHRIPLIGALGNLVAIPGFAIMLVWSVILLAMSVVFPPAAGIAGTVVDVLAVFLGNVVRVFANLPLAGVRVGTVPVWAVAGLFVAGTIATIGFASRRGRLALTGLLIAANVIIWAPLTTKTMAMATVAFLDVGNGDAAVVTSGGNHVLIDAGPANDYWSAADAILSYLQQKGVTKLETLVLSHPDNDHVGGAVELLSRLPVDLVCTNGDSSLTVTWINLELALRSRGIASRVLHAGDEMILGRGVTLRALWPDSAAMATLQGDNQRSLVFRLDAGEASALFMADADTVVEEFLLGSRLDLDAELLKVAHHGSATSTGTRFLDAVSAEWAAISVGRLNRFCHPSPDVLERLNRSGVATFTTCAHGTLEFATDGKSWIQQESGAESLARRLQLPHD